jgi:methyl-accepting chemotaxis protein
VSRSLFGNWINFNFFKNLGMAWKLAVVPALAVLALLAVYGITTTNLNTYQAKVDQAAAAESIIKDLKAAQVAEERYLKGQDEAAIKEVQSRLEKVKSRARKTKATLNEAKDRQRMDSIIQAAGKFAAGFRQTVELTRASEKLRGQMLEAARIIEEKSQALAEGQGAELAELIRSGGAQNEIRSKQSEAKSAWLMTVRLKEARLKEKNYIQRDSEQDLKEAKALIDKVRAMAGDLERALDEPADKKLMADIRAASQDYKQGLDKFAERREAKQDEVARMSAIAADLAKKATTLAEAQQKERSMVRAGLESTVLGVNLAAMALTALVAFVLTRLILGPIRSVSEAVQHIQRNKDFTHRAEAEGNDEINQMAAAVNDLVDHQAGILGEIQEQSTQVASASEELSSTAEEITQNARSSSQRVEQVSGSAQEVNNVVQDVANNISEVSDSASKSTEATKEGMSTVHTAAERINELKSSSDRVTEIMETIESIAKKTDLLALNAAIEAANAGEQGKGFAVVADEVRKLAEQTSEATSQVNDIVSELRNQSDSSVEAMQGVESKMGEVLEAIESTDQTANQIAAAAEELAATMSETTDNMGEITGNVEQVASSVTQVEQAAQQLGELANNLKGNVSQFRLK